MKPIDQNDFVFAVAMFSTMICSNDLRRLKHAKTSTDPSGPKSWRGAGGSVGTPQTLQDK
jgi:hypothetical protein